MADTYALTGNVKAVADLTLKVTSGSGAISRYKSDVTNLRYSADVASGGGDNKANDFYEEIVALGAGATATIDFVSATTLNRFGLPLAWDLLKGLWLYAPTTNPDTVTVGGAANAVIIELPPISPGDLVMLAYPLIATAPVIAAGASDILTIVNDDAGVAAVLNVLAWGEKA